MTTIGIQKNTGKFAENKDVARDLRTKELLPALHRGEKITIDFDGVEVATQSFMHALLSEAIRTFGNDLFEKVEFKNCNESIQQIISVVANYMQESMEE